MSEKVCFKQVVFLALKQIKTKAAFQTSGSDIVSCFKALSISVGKNTDTGKRHLQGHQLYHLNKSTTCILYISLIVNPNGLLQSSRFAYTAPVNDEKGSSSSMFHSLDNSEVIFSLVSKAICSHLYLHTTAQFITPSQLNKNQNNHVVEILDKILFYLISISASFVLNANIYLKST